MTTLNEGRNEIRFNNSGGKCLLENWVEERAVENLDPVDLNADDASSSQVFKDGHRGLLTTDLQANPEKLTTFTDSYRPPKGPDVRQKGSKQELLEKMIYEQVSQEVHKEFNPEPEPINYNSVTHQDFNVGEFESVKPAPTASHDYISDQPVSFWTEHKDKIHGRSQVKPTFDSAFRKNTAFSKPIDEYWDQAPPYEHELAPNM